MSNIASMAAALIFLLYLIIYSFACPRRELLLSVACEILFFLCLAIWRYTRSRTVGSHAKSAVVAQLTEDIKPLARARYFYHYSWLAVWIVVCILGFLDFAALSFAVFGNLKASEVLYTRVPTMRLIGAHPAATAEILSGAYLNAGKFAEAEKIYGLIKDVRHDIYGADGESSVGLLADYGDLYYLQKQYAKAVPCYLSSIDLSRKSHGATGYGRPLTGLANCYRELGQFEKSEALYQDALKMRSHLYGSNSEKVSATLKEYARLLEKMERKVEFASALARSATIDKLQKKEESNPYVAVAIMLSIFVISFFLFGKKRFFTRIATTRLQAKVSGSTAPHPADIKRLAVLNKYQGLE